LNVIFLSLLISCSLEDAGPISDPCDNARIYSFSTNDPYSPSTIQVEEADETLDPWGSFTDTSDLGSAIMPSNVSTYNFTTERYHFFSLVNSKFINVNADDTINVIPQTGGINGWKFSGLVYVSSLNTYYMIGFSYIDGAVGLVKVLNIDTGELADVPTVTVPLIDFSFSVVEIDPFVLNMSVATDNNDKVFVLSGRNIITFEIGALTANHETIGLSSDNFYGLEYNNLVDKLNAFKYETSTILKLVEITPVAIPFVSDESMNIIAPIDELHANLTFYSTTLSCDEKTFIIAHKFANASTKFYRIPFGGVVSSVVPSLIIPSTKPTYYFGIESNANN